MFTAPFTFPNTSVLHRQQPDYPQRSHIIEQSFHDAQPTTVQYWEALDEHRDRGVVVGCEDGTLYVFQHTEVAPTPQLSSRERKKRPRSPLPIVAPRAAAPGSPTASSASFVLSPTRPRAVSGVTAEKVEAPRNYVDFDDEPDKLKDILQGRNPKEKQTGHDAVSLTVSPVPSIAESLSITSKRKSPPRSLLSRTNSPEHTSRSFSTPGSPLEQSAASTSTFSLSYHIIPDCAGLGHAVRAVEVLDGSKYVVVLHQPGDLSVYSLQDGRCLVSVSVPEESDTQMSRETWNWCSLNVSVVDESVLLFITASTDSNTSAATPDLEEASSEKSRTSIFKFTVGPDDVKLERLGQWESAGPASGLGIYQDLDGSSAFYSINTAGHLLISKLQLGAPTPLHAPSSTPTAEPEQSGHLALQKTLRAMVSRSDPEKQDHPHTVQPQKKILCHEPEDVGLVIGDSTVSGLVTRHIEGKLYGIVWAHREMSVFIYQASTLRILYQSPVNHLEDAIWIDDNIFVLCFNDRMEIHRLRNVSSDNEWVKFTSSEEGNHQHPDLVRVVPTGRYEAGSFTSSGDRLFIQRDVTSGRRKLVSCRIRPENEGPDTILWQSTVQDETVQPVVQTANLPIELELVIQGYSDGRLRQFSLEHMILNKSASLLASSGASKTSNPPLHGSVIGLRLVQNSRTRERYIVGGIDDGSIAFWNMTNFELCARWIAFCVPLVQVVDFEEEAGGLLHGCVLCVSADGTIGVIVVDGFQFLYTIPGSPSPLKSLSLCANNLLLIYGNSLARLWDVQAKEFRRSMSSDKAAELLGHDDWSTVYASLIFLSPRPHVNPTAAATLKFSLEKFVVNSIATTKKISTNKDEIRDILHTFDRLRMLLSVSLTPGLSQDVDSICTGKLDIQPTAVGVGLSSAFTTTLYKTTNPQDAWCISGNLSAARMLAIVFILRALSLFEASSEAAGAVISFYTTSLGPCIGPKYVPPSLEFLGRMWFDATSELRHSIRIVFDATLARLSDQEVIAIAEKWQPYLPSLQPGNEDDSIRTALALFLCGAIAAEKFSLLSVNALIDISKSVALYFHDENSTHRVLAIDLCSKGFNVWQQYVDTLDILRSLFMLATTTRKAAISIQNVGAQARSAVLSIASQNTALFMSTLCLDVLDPSSLEHRRSVLQIIAFLIRKRPIILQPHLSRLMEAVIKSLDPNSNANREAVLGAATEIIGYVVKMYPTVDFHMTSQRLAVGTNEGAVVMYDLKTAIRLYVLEGHRHQLTACSFSPDGRRLVTLSLADCQVLVWKVGTSLVSFFNPGAPPRQGHGGSQPFKTFPFNLGQERTVELAPAESLEAVGFEWSGDRSVKVKIREVVLTFST
ncbi:hypothetical protein FA15DRAFT_635254 [Coprinopsis marcescibilis]|uniref:Uncharacterized protein n=1 Tax=Coprinopsis marcescibilis TaxID=230819 RepID=A0A5C3L4N5_COPMA|nr:hypothetical protein FA15DRAFT_635254 [Coprinopsis marcescibilis]